MTLDPAVVIAAIGTLSTAFGTVLRIFYVHLTHQIDYWRTSSEKWQERAFENEALANHGTQLAERAVTLRKRG